MRLQSHEKSILFYIGNLNRGGAERVIVNLAAYFRDCGYRVAIVTKEQGDTEYPVPEGVTRMLADITEDEIGRNRIANLYRRIIKLRNIFKQIKPDYIVSFIKKNNFMAIVSAVGLHIPVIVSVRSNPAREYPDKITRILANVLFAHASGVVLQTQRAREFFSAAVQKNAVVLPNSISEQFLQTEHEIGRKKEIVWVGRMDSNKNPGMIFRAFGDIAEKYPDWTLKFIGDGPLGEELKESNRKEKYANQVCFMGYVEDVAAEIRSASVFVLTSKQEGMPNALIEAMVSGIAVISTDCPCGGPAELITNGKNGILISVDDEKELVKALDMLLSQEEYRNRLSAEAKKLIEKVHPDIVNRQWLEYIETK